MRDLHEPYRAGYLDALRDVAVTLLQLKAAGQESLDEILHHVQDLIDRVETPTRMPTGEARP